MLKDMQLEGEDLERARQCFDRGDYDGALKEYQTVLDKHRSAPPGDEALFYTGLIYTHQERATGDYVQALAYFEKLAKHFPQSRYAEQARIWIVLMRRFQKLDLATVDLSRSLKKAQQDNDRLNREIEELKKTIKRSRQVDIEIDGKKKELSK